jgi:hypothetical protein
MYIKKRGKAAKAKAAAAAEGKEDGGGGGGGGGGMMSEDDFDHRLGNYQLMEAIGKGGYGTVYRGLDIERGMTVAVKRVNLQGIPHEELESIEVSGSGTRSGTADRTERSAIAGRQLSDGCLIFSPILCPVLA